MSTPFKKSTSWFASLGGALGRKRHSGPGQKRRPLRFESLETRSLLSATVLPSISGIVYEDPTGNGVASSDLRLANVTVNLFRDGGDGIFEGNNPGSDDSLVGTTTSNANGAYQFNEPLCRHLFRSAGSGARTGNLFQPIRAEGGRHQRRPARHAGHDDRLVCIDFAVRQRFAARRQDRDVLAINLGRHRRPSQPVRATHDGRRRRVAGRGLPIGPACWTTAPTPRPTASSGSTGTATTATPPS